MIVVDTPILGLKIIEPRVYEDERGFFFESFNSQSFSKAVGRDIEFVQDNHSKSVKGVLRGLHYQVNKVQAKLVRVIQGEIFDVAVDLRKDSVTYGEWFGGILSCKNKRQLWIPEGFAHGFLVLSNEAEVLYKTTDYYSPQDERSIVWNDEKINIQWPDLGIDLVLSEKDRNADDFNATVLA